MMVSTQEGDAESLSMKIGAVHGERELRAKLEILKEEMAIEEIGAKQHVDEMNGVKKVCNICGKAFESGKALGGHMRIHVRGDRVLKKKLSPHQSIKFKKQLNKVKKNATTGDGYDGLCKMVETPTCKLCSRRFKSLKSLFGHMRSHPDRGWRGINPPSSMGSSISSSSSYSSSLLDADPPELGDQVEGLDSKERTDLTKALLRGWTVTAKRGRKAVMAMAAMLADEDDVRAVNGLMMLSRGSGSVDESHAAYDEIVRANNVCESEEWMIDQSVVEINQKKTGVVEINQFKDQECFKSNGKSLGQPKKDEGFEGMVTKNNKRRKKVKLHNLEFGTKNEEIMKNDLVNHKVHQMKMQHNNKYQHCNTRDELTFTAHQIALGSHSSVHNFMDHATARSEAEAEECKKTGTVNLNDNRPQRLLDFDLNEMPPLMDDEAAGGTCKYEVDGYDHAAYCP